MKLDSAFESGSSIKTDLVVVSGKEPGKNKYYDSYSNYLMSDPALDSLWVHRQRRASQNELCNDSFISHVYFTGGIL